MAEPRWVALRQRLLEGGVSPRRVRRLLSELRTHYRELLAEEQQAGIESAAAEQRALRRLGSEDVLAEQMLAQTNLLSWSRRWPWAVYGIGPLLLFTTLFVAGCFLMAGMARVLHGLHQASALRLLALMQAIALLMLYGLPVLIAAAMALLAVRRRVALGWAMCAVSLLCFLGSLTNVDVSMHSAQAGLGIKTDLLAGVLLHRWLPSALAAVVLAGLVVWAARALRPHEEEDAGRSTT